MLKHNTKYENIDLKELPFNHFNYTCFRTVENDTIIYIKKAKCRTYNDILISFKLEEPTALLKWKQENEIEDETFYNSFKHARMSTHETRLYRPVSRSKSKQKSKSNADGQVFTLRIIWCAFRVCIICYVICVCIDMCL